MAFPGIQQPEIIQIDDTLRLRRFDGVFDFAFSWYQDEELVYLVDGRKERYDMDQLSRMYHYLNRQGELYFIELWDHGQFRPIGDVTFWQEDMPIVIGDPACRGKKIGRKVIAALVQRGIQLGYDHLEIGEIYHWNPASIRCFESQGFRPWEKTEKGARYRKDL